MTLKLAPYAGSTSFLKRMLKEKCHRCLRLGKTWIHLGVCRATPLGNGRILIILWDGTMAPQCTHLAVLVGPNQLENIVLYVKPSITQEHTAVLDNYW